MYCCIRTHVTGTSVVCGKQSIPQTDGIRGTQLRSTVGTCLDSTKADIDITQKVSTSRAHHYRHPTLSPIHTTDVELHRRCVRNSQLVGNSFDESEQMCQQSSCVCNHRELAANCVHTADATQQCTGHYRRQLGLEGTHVGQCRYGRMTPAAQ